VPRVYVPELGMTLSGTLWRRLRSLPAALAVIACRRPCCRFGNAALLPDRAVHHSLRCRLAEAAELAGQPASMRIDHAYRSLERVGARLAAVNSALDAAGLPRLSHEHVDTQKALLSRGATASGVA
jgi:hypothetical protein